MEDKDQVTQEVTMPDLLDKIVKAEKDGLLNSEEIKRLLPRIIAALITVSEFSGPLDEFLTRKITEEQFMEIYRTQGKIMPVVYTAAEVAEIICDWESSQKEEEWKEHLKKDYFINP